MPMFLKTQEGDYLFLPPQSSPLAFSKTFLGSEYGYVEAVTVAISRDYATTVYEFPCEKPPADGEKPARAQRLLDALVNHFAAQSTPLTNDILDMEHFVRQMLPQFAIANASSRKEAP